MTRRRPYVSRAPERVLQRSTYATADALVQEIEASADRGMVVVVRRFGVQAFSIVRNDMNMLVKPHPPADREPVGTYHDAATALRAGDRWADASARGEVVEVDGGDNWPRGAA